MYTLARLLIGVSVIALAATAHAQDAPQPAPPAADLPDVEVIQKKGAAPAQKAATPKQPVAKKQAPPPQPDFVPAQVEPEVVDQGPNPAYGAARSGGAAARAQSGPIGPINPTSIVPTDLSDFSSAGTRVTSERLDSQLPANTNDAFRSVPGVHVVNDDGFGRHGGIGMRGSPPRRGRKVLHLEDGQPINMSVWLDPSVHYVPPVDRLESIEVLRGVVINHGPLNNHGVVNFRNLSPFGPNETEISASIGWIDNDKGGEFVDDGDPPVFSTADQSVSNTRHVHTRQGIGNVGVVLSYSGADAEGAWDNERLRYNDFYGAIGFKGINSDLTFSAMHFRQRDDYDEANFEGTEAQFFSEVGHCKTCYNVGSNFNTYNADVTKLQLVHNVYLDDTTTITSRIYGFHHRRDRYQNIDEGDPTEVDPADVIAPFFDAGTSAVYIGEGSMLGRLRTYRQLGAEIRGEWAERPFIAGTTQDIQAGVRYEYNDFTNKNFFGLPGQILEDGDETGFSPFDREYDAHAFSAFLQSALHVTRDVTVTPGARLEHYRVSRQTFGFITREEGELDELDDCDVDSGIATPFGNDECLVLELENPAFPSESFTATHFLPGVAVSYDGFYRSTIYGGYNRGLTTHVLREERFPAEDEIGDNFQLGLRSTAIKGVTFDIAGFYEMIENFQIKGSGTDGAGNNIYSTADEVEIKGFEVYGRVDSRAYTGGPFNLYFEGTFTLSDAKFEADSEDPTIVGNYVPEVSREVAHLTAGFAHQMGWDASVSYTYRGEFFTDEANTPFGGDDEGEDGLVPSVWLLSARASMKIGDTGASLFVAADNITDELYISDREDGIKPGLGRSFWAGMKYKFN